MNILRNRRVALGFAALAPALALTLLNACAVEGVGVDGSVGVVGYDAGYYEPYGYEYGGWGSGYRVGPGRGGDPRGGHPGSYRRAPASRPTPSIPNRPRGGGGPRGGGPHH
jgi:squid-like protein/heterogeneous nuclear ribonucleoprotein A1/A3